MSRVDGVLLTSHGLIRGSIHHSERIERIEPGDVDGPLLLPGFIDVHVHGGGGADTMDGADAVRRLARLHLSHGTTTILPTTVTNPWTSLMSALDGVAEVRRDRGSEMLPDIPGVHFEGPFINPERLGAQPPFAIPAEPDLVRQVIARDVVRLVTLAPEMPGVMAAAEEFARAGVRVSIGHSAASYEVVIEAYRRLRELGGVVGFTHIFNAMGGVEGRNPGVAGAALGLVEAFAELIFDRHHVYPGAMQAARAAKRDRLLFVTDCLQLGGVGDGETELGGQKVIVKDGAARLESGTLAGSIMTTDGALRNALSEGIPLAEASALLSATPARYLGLADRGELAVGKRADMVALDEEYRVLDVWVGGRRLHG